MPGPTPPKPEDEDDGDWADDSGLPKPENADPVPDPRKGD